LKTPSVQYPTLVRGFIHGPIRCESLDGSELWLPPREGKITMEPFKADGKTFCVSHLQKRATFFSLLFKPFIYHQWIGKPQEQVAGLWIPGSEKGNLLLGGYWRTPGWRWDSDPNLPSPWVWSWGRAPGTHLD